MIGRPPRELGWTGLKIRTSPSHCLGWRASALLVAALLLAVPTVWIGHYFLTRSSSRDQLRAILSAATAGHQCATLNYAVGPDRAVDISGHVSTPDDLETATYEVAKIPGISGTPHLNVQLMIWPYCEVVGFLSPLLARPSGDAPRLKLASGGNEARIGECLKLDVLAPSFDSFIYVDYFDAEGEVLHLLPNRWDILDH
jgi:hypothetical protein